jgi:hypothetical protein
VPRAGPSPSHPLPAQPPSPAQEQIAEIRALAVKFETELASEPRLSNWLPFILDQIKGIGDLPDPSRWSEEHLDQLLIFQRALDNTFQPGDSRSGIGVINFGVLAPLLKILSALLDGGELSGDHSVVVNNELIHYLNEIREAIRHLAAADMPPVARTNVKLLDDSLHLAEHSRRIDLKQVDRIAGRIRRHRLGALHRLVCLTAVLIGKRTDRAPDLAIFRDELQGGGYGPELVIVPAGGFQMGSPEGEGDSDEHPQHGVTIARRFAVGVCPVTRGEFAAFVEVTNYDAGERWRDPGFSAG